MVRRMNYTLFCHSEERSDEESLMSTLIVAYAGSNSLRSVGILRCAQNDKTVHDHVDHYRDHYTIAHYTLSSLVE